MYCQNNVFGKTKEPSLGNFFEIKKMEMCDGCKKCWEECPCGFIVGQ
jgi:NAD-dependent dihydropyrimidine dehydrogenase PreA subunit